MRELKIGLVGATGVVGQTLLDLVDGPFSAVKVTQVRAFASPSSVGKRLSCAVGTSVTVEAPSAAALSECDAVFFAAEADVAKKYVPGLVERGVLCIDKSAAYRADPAVPLVVPEVNGAVLGKAPFASPLVIANPNCCAIPLVMTLAPLEKTYGVKRVVVSTYQSVSGAGKPGMGVLEEETRAFFSTTGALHPEPSAVFPQAIAFNVIPYVAALLENGDTDEEAKIIAETQRLLARPELPIAATSVRVPTFVGHALSVTVELGNATAVPTVEGIEDVLRAFPGIELAEAPRGRWQHDIDAYKSGAEGAAAPFATPRQAQGADSVFVSRVRPAKVFENGFSLWIVCDNLRKGAALNALQIIDHLASKGLLPKRA